MKNLREIEELLRIAMEALGDIPYLLKDAGELNTEVNKKIIGKSIYEFGNIREMIYRIDPTLEPKEKLLYEQNEKSYRKLISLTAEAWKFEETGKYQGAKTKYQSLLSESDIPHFQLIAQAGLYRINEIELTSHSSGGG